MVGWRVDGWRMGWEIDGGMENSHLTMVPSLEAEKMCLLLVVTTTHVTAFKRPHVPILTSPTDGTSYCKWHGWWWVRVVVMGENWWVVVGEGG